MHPSDARAPRPEHTEQDLSVPRCLQVFTLSDVFKSETGADCAANKMCNYLKGFLIKCNEDMKTRNTGNTENTFIHKSTARRANMFDSELGTAGFDRVCC